MSNTYQHTVEIDGTEYAIEIHYDYEAEVEAHVCDDGELDPGQGEVVEVTRAVMAGHGEVPSDLWMPLGIDIGDTIATIAEVHRQNMQAEADEKAEAKSDEARHRGRGEA